MYSTPVLAVDHRVVDTALAVGNHGEAGRLCLDRHHPEVFKAREQERSGLCEQARHVVVGDLSEELAVGAGEVPHALEVTSLAGDEQPASEALACLDRDADPLVGHDAAEDKIRVAFAAVDVEHRLDVYRGMDDLALPPVRGLDPARRQSAS